MGIKTYNNLSSIKQKLFEIIPMLEEIKKDDNSLFEMYSLSDIEYVFTKSYDAFGDIVKYYGAEIDTNNDEI